MGDRNIQDLHPDLQPLCVALLGSAKAAGIDARIIFTWRTTAEQDALYAQGRTTPGKIVTTLTGIPGPHQSKHCFTIDGKPASKAFDAAVFEADDTYVSSGSDPRYAAMGHIWNDMAAQYPDLGLVYGGDWKTFKDSDHFQIA